MRSRLDHLVLNDKRPIIGICVGMQMMARYSEEGESLGLGWIDGHVKKFNIESIPYHTKLPHMGWNDISFGTNQSLFKNLGKHARFYFLHSFYFHCTNESNIISTTTYGVRFASAVQSENIIGVQFHPEKSHQAGETVLKNFAQL